MRLSLIVCYYLIVLWTDARKTLDSGHQMHVGGGHRHSCPLFGEYDGGRWAFRLAFAVARDAGACTAIAWPGAAHAGQSDVPRLDVSGALCAAAHLRVVWVAPNCNHWSTEKLNA